MSEELYTLEVAKTVRRHVKDKAVLDGIARDLTALLLSTMKKKEEASNNYWKDLVTMAFTDSLEQTKEPRKDS